MITGFELESGAGIIVLENGQILMLEGNVPSGSVVADGAGNYTITGLPNATYTITPSLAGYTFTPVSRQVTVNGANVTGVNFTATKGAGGKGFGEKFEFSF